MILIDVGGSQNVPSEGIASNEKPTGWAGIPPVRGDLVISPGEMITLTGSHEYSSAHLGPGSVVTLDDCEMNLDGGADGRAIFSGSPSSLVLKNSSIRVWSSGGSGLVSSEGGCAVFDISSTGAVTIEYSFIYLKGGDGYESSQKGAYFEKDIGGRMFAGGNASMSIIPGNGSALKVVESAFLVKGGNGGDAPDGEDVTSDSLGRSGGYTIGGDVTGSVGAGGEGTLMIEAPYSDILIRGTEISIKGGAGGNAGHAGSVIWSGDVEYNTPTSAGGYSSGGLDGGDIIGPGTVSGNVGCGGNASISMDAGSMTLELSFVNAWGGYGGHAGNGGNCRAVGGGGSTVTRTNGGGGGAGYSGAISGDVSGDNGGDVLGRVGSAGSTTIEVRSAEYLTSVDNYFHNVRNLGGLPGIGGTGGGVDEPPFSFEGGGGGGGGYSGGAGGPARTTAPTPIGGAGGVVGTYVGGGGDNSMIIETPCLMASGAFNLKVSEGVPGREYSTLDGESGEVGVDLGKMGGPGGSGSHASETYGNRYWSIPPPSPMMTDPVDREVISDPGLTFAWDEAVSDHWGTIGITYDFRLMSGNDPGSYVQKISTSQTGTPLDKDPGDGIWYWTVRCRNSTAVSNWSVPFSFVLDRAPPAIDVPAGEMWVPAFNPVRMIHMSDGLSGIDPDGTEFRFGPVGGGLSSWRGMNFTSNETGMYGGVDLPGVEGSYEVWIMAVDLAGNGPTVAGPMIMNVDGTDPTISGIMPTGWTSGENGIEFQSIESGSGLAGTAGIIVHDLNLSFEQELIGIGGDMYRIEGISDIPDGNHSMTIMISDLVGNTAVKGPMDLLIDGSDPVILLENPVHGSWANISNPVIEGAVSDVLSGVGSAVLTIRDKAGGIMESAVLSLNHSGRFSHEVVGDLPDGRYDLEIECTDNAGNAVSTGTIEFGVDTVPPSVEILGALVRPSGNIVDVSFRSLDGRSGIDQNVVEVLIPAAGGWDVVSTFRFEDQGGSGDDAGSISIPFDASHPVVYFRMYSVDNANNTSPGSEVFRADPPGADPSVDMVTGNMIGPDQEIVMVLTDPFNIDVDSIEYQVDRENETGNWTPVGSVDIVKTGTVGPFDLPPGAGSVSVTLTMDRDWIDPDIFLRWKDGLPLGGYKTVGPVHLDIDRDPPDLVIRSDPISLENPVRIGIGSDDGSMLTIIPTLMVRLGEGNWTDVGREGGPMLVDEGIDGYSLLVNVTWGEVTEISVMARDQFGNTVIKTITVRATRSPDVSIMGAPEGEIQPGSGIKLYANCSDPDGDRLSYRWEMDGVAEGEGSSLSLDPDPGDHEIILYASDGDLEANTSITITVSEDGGGGDRSGISPLLFIVPLMILLVAAGIGIAIFLNARKGGSDDEEEEEEFWGDDDSDDDRKTDKKIKCGLCMRAVTDTGRSVKCRCGERFHVKCAMREGVCPECGREILIPAEI